MRIGQLLAPIAQPVIQNRPVPAQPQVQQAALHPNQDNTAVRGLPKGIPALNPLFSREAEPALPPIQVIERDNYTYFRNAYGVQITQVQMEDGKYFMAFGQDGLGVMLKENTSKRDTLNFSDMNFNIPSPSKIPNVFFHVEGNTPSTMSFDKQHNLVISLSNGDQVKLDGHDAQTLLKGPFSIKFNPDEAGENFDVVYIGNQPVKRFKSKGDKVDW